MTSWELLSYRWFWVLVHSLWQQSLVAIGLWVILRSIAARNAERRYAVALCVFAISALLPVVTWAWMTTSGNGSSTTTNAAIPGRPAQALPSGGNPDPAPPSSEVKVASTDGLPESETSSSVANAVADRSRAWIVLLLCWCAGTTIHLVCAMRDFSATSTLLQGSSLRDSELLSHVERARHLLQLRRRFEVLISPADVGPFVFGLWKPTLVLPASLMAGLPPDQLEAILLHELAHLRRYDDVVNLLQRLVEAVFFFNPALLWMSSVLRREREAACDARAVACIGSPFSLAEALVRVAEALGPATQPALASLSLNFADHEDSGALLDRVRRIVSPNERPRLRLTWPALVGSLLLLGLLCAGLERATLWSIAIARDWLSPEQRIAAVAEVLGDFKPAPIDRQTEERFRLKGTIRTPDGAPLSETPGHIYSVSRRVSGGGTSTASASYDCKGDQFDVSPDPGECWLMYYNDKYAPSIVGPFRGAGGDVKDEIEIVLKAGSPGAVRVVDAKGTPVAGASVTALPDWGLSSFIGPSLPEKTDEKGIWKSDHLADTPYRLTIRAPGFSTFNSPKSVRITNQPMDFTLDPSDPIRAIVIDQQGNPVSGARVGMLAERKPGSQNTYGGSGNLVAETRDDGTFQLDDVSLESTYDLLIDAKEKGHAIVGPLRVDGKLVHVELQKKLTLAGQVHGDAGELADLRKASISCASPLDGTKSSLHVSTQIDEEGNFKFDSLLTGNYQLSIGAHVIKGRLDDSKSDLIVDLKELQRSERDVDVRFVERGQLVRPGGSVGVQMEILDEGGQRVFGGPRAIVDGKVRLRVRTPDTLHLVPDGCLGYWFDDVSLPVPAGDEPFVAEVPVLPAGALRVKVLASVKRGEDRPRVGAGVQFAVSTATGERTISFHRNPGAGDEVVLSPVPLDVPCRVSASQEYRRAFSPVFRLEGDAPVRDMTLALPSAIEAVIRVESFSGEVLSRIPLEVNYSPPVVEQGGPRILSPGGMTWQNNQLVTDREGRVTLQGMPANEEGYSITAKSSRDWQPGTALIRTDGGTTVLTLLRGKVLEGKVVDEKTGRGVPAISLRAMSTRPPRSGSVELPPEAPTDSEGNFRFSNLPDEMVRLVPVAAHQKQPEVMPGTNESVTVEIQVP